MDFMTIDQEKCIRCGACINECPVGIIMLKENAVVPCVVDGAEKICIDCGHCVAVCPTGAYDLLTMKADDCEAVLAAWRIDDALVEHFLKARRSIRVYQQTLVERQKIERLINVARYAPSGKNVQPVKWMVVYEHDAVMSMAQCVIDWMKYTIKHNSDFAKTLFLHPIVLAWKRGHDLVFRGAPHVVIAYGEKANMSAPQAATIALTYLEIAAASMNLGTCWAGYFYLASTMWQPLQEMLALPDGHACMGAQMLGFSDVTYPRIPKRNDVQVMWK